MKDLLHPLDQSLSLKLTIGTTDKHFLTCMRLTYKRVGCTFPRSLELDDQIGLDGTDGYPWVYCSFDEDQVETAEALEIGQTVTFQCVGSDNWSIGPALKHCVLISAR